MRRCATPGFHSATRTVALQAALKQCPQPFDVLMDRERWWSLPCIWQKARTNSPMFTGSHSSDWSRISMSLPCCVRIVSIYSILSISHRSQLVVVERTPPVYFQNFCSILYQINERSSTFQLHEQQGTELIAL